MVCLFQSSEARAESLKPHDSNLKLGCNSDHEKSCVIKQLLCFLTVSPSLKILNASISPKDKNQSVLLVIRIKFRGRMQVNVK